MRATESVPISDIYADGLSHLEICGPNVRFVYFVWENGQKIVTAKIVKPISAIVQIADMLNMARASEINDVRH